MAKKSQSAIEFVMVTGIVLFSFVVFFIVIGENMSDKIKERQNNNLKEIALTVKNEIDLAFYSDEGYIREFEVPLDINGQEYEIEIINQMVSIKTTDEKYGLAIPVQNISGQINKGDNIIKKQNGRVVLNV